MGLSRLGRSLKRPPFGLKAKVATVALLGLSFVVIWSFSPPSSFSSRRNSFGDIKREKSGQNFGSHKNSESGKIPIELSVRSVEKGRVGNGEKAVRKDKDVKKEMPVVEKTPKDSEEKQEESEEKVEEEKEESGEATDGDGQVDETIDGGDDADIVDEEVEETTDEKVEGKKEGRKNSGPLFDSKGRYNWKLCGGKSGYNYVPCVDLEGTGTGKLRSHRHHERSCPNASPMCLTPLPPGYWDPVPWPESQSKIFYRNVAHPKLSAFIKTCNWLKLSGDHITFSGNASIFIGGADHYIEFIEEMVPDLDWGKNIRVVLDIGCTDNSFSVSLLRKEVLTLSLGLMSDQTDLAQISLERGLPAVIGSLRARRLPFPDGVFDAIHCGECNIPWHSSGGRILLEMNRILHPGGYFVVSFRHGEVEDEKAMSNLTTSIYWNNLGHQIDDETDLSVKIYQRPSSNDVYELRRKGPPLCKEQENQKPVWYAPIQKCLHTLPTAVEQRGTDWPEEWPKRLETFPEWLADIQEEIMADIKHWKAIVNKSYLSGMGINWSHVRNVMDMATRYGGFAAALTDQKVWVMNVVPVYSPNTLPIIYERGLIGIYHDWCEPFSTYPRSYDLLHADHLFSRLKNRCKQPTSIVVEMDRILRPGGWAIIRDKVEILNPLESMLKTLHWDITMTYSQHKQGIICVQKTAWRP